MTVSITYDSTDTNSLASEFAKEHHLSCSPFAENNTTLSLNFTNEGTELRDNDKNISIHIDFLSGNLAHRQQFGGGRGQSIAKAGLAKDAYVLACLGCSMTLLERSPIITELIKDAIKRAEDNEDFQSILKTGFKVVTKSSIDYLMELEKNEKSKRPDVIYLDPMYPHRKKSASVKKNMQILQKLLGQDTDTQELLNIALKTARKRVVVKRPKGAENLTDINPTYIVESKKTRYDVYIIQQ
jgi:16S rRNA (guanine1516-N2)-methyltransferase